MNADIHGIDEKLEILKRLNRIEGQIKGIHKMIDSDAQCGDILIQISAVRAATNSIGVMLLEKYSKDCILDASNSSDYENTLKNYLTTVQKFIKFSD